MFDKQSEGKDTSGWSIVLRGIRLDSFVLHSLLILFVPPYDHSGVMETSCPLLGKGKTTLNKTLKSEQK